MGLRQGGFPCKGRGELGSSPSSAAQPGRRVGGVSLSLGHEGVGAALIGAVGLAPGWQPLLGVHLLPAPVATSCSAGGGERDHEAGGGRSGPHSLQHLPLTWPNPTAGIWRLLLICSGLRALG